MMAEFRKYMIIGGMPQAVGKYLESNSMSEVEDIKEDILNLYRSDMAKIPGTTGTAALGIFNDLPGMLNAHSKVFSPGKINEGTRTREYGSALVWLREAKIINQCYRLGDPGIAYSLATDPLRFKNYFFDTGLRISLAFGKKRKNLDETYAALLRGKPNVNEGMFFENVIAQELVANGYDLRFSEFYHKDSANLQEVDFIIPGAKKIYPLESKPATSSKHVSLDRFTDKYRDRVEKAYVIHTKEMKTEGKTVFSLCIWRCISDCGMFLYR